VFVEVLQVARENQLSRFGTRQPRRHQDPRQRQPSQRPVLWARRGHRGATHRPRFKNCLALAEEADGANVPDGMGVPEELQRREDRLTAIAEAKGKIEARAAERFAREQADYQAKLAARAAKAAASGKKPGGKAAQAARARPACRRPDQPHRRRVADHGRGWRWLRAVLQRPSHRRYRDHAGPGAAGHAGCQR
jgi:hypothetical protein